MEEDTADDEIGPETELRVDAFCLIELMLLAAACDSDVGENSLLVAGIVELAIGDVVGCEEDASPVEAPEDWLDKEDS